MKTFIFAVPILGTQLFVDAINHYNCSTQGKSFLLTGATISCEVLK